MAEGAQLTQPHAHYTYPTSDVNASPPNSAGQVAGVAAAHGSAAGTADAAAASYPTGERPAERRHIEVLTWNIAAVNNNPFEYWVTHNDPAYNELMKDVQNLIDDPAERDPDVGEIFTDEMFEELMQDLSDLGMEGLDEVGKRWTSEYRGRKAINGFLKDKSIGSKRLASMPDRITNTINTVSGGVLLRPTVINCFEGELNSIDSWWAQWRHFMFHTQVQVVADKKHRGPQTVVKLLEPILHSKYPAITAEEQAISIPLQILCLAIFDAILVHMLNTIAAVTWQGLRSSLCRALHREKDDQINNIIEHSYPFADVVCIQEAAAAYVDRVLSHPSLSQRYMVLHPQVLDGKRDQNSVILANKKFFNEETATDVTPLVLKELERWQSAPGDLVAVSIQGLDGLDYLLASFHGDTNGLTTLPVVTAVHRTVQETLPGHILIFGLDANTYKEHSDDYQGVRNFYEYITSKGMGSCWGASPDPLNSTTCNARTYLQPQLNKAVGLKEKLQKADKNLKDWIIFYSPQMKSSGVLKDNTGRREYVEEMIFPTLSFPSDHAVVSATLLCTLPPRSAPPDAASR